MFGAMLGKVAAAIIGTISALGYLGIVLLMAIESACIPLPSEIIMPFSGYLVSSGRFSLVAVATAGAVGCNLGSTAAYLVGAWGGERAVRRWGRYVLLDQSALKRAEWFFNRYGAVTIFVSRLLPVARTFISLPAGVARMPVLKFQLYTFAGSWLWCWALAYIGVKLGEAWDTNPAFKRILHSADIAIITAFLALIVWYAIRRFQQHKDRAQ